MSARRVKFFEMKTDSGRAVPAKKKFHFSTRDNSIDKWSHEGVIGALEVDCEPTLDLEGTLTPLQGMDGDADSWKEAQKAWNTEALRESFLKACKNVPIETACCGLIQDDDERIRNLVPYLNQHWAPVANEKLEKHGVSINAFLWHWKNVQGKAETIILLIRFVDMAVSV
jgi:hypothetical protein